MPTLNSVGCSTVRHIDRGKLSRADLPKLFLAYVNAIDGMTGKNGLSFRALHVVFRPRAGRGGGGYWLTYPTSPTTFNDITTAKRNFYNLKSSVCGQNRGLK